MKPEKKIIFSWLCGQEDERDDFEDFELATRKNDNNVVSHASSCFGSISSSGENLNVRDNDVPADGEYTGMEANWELPNKTEKAGQISENLRTFGNVKKKRMSSNILKDMLGVDGDLSLVKVKENRDKSMAKEKRKLDLPYLAFNHYFEHKMKKRRCILEDNID